MIIAKTFKENSLLVKSLREKGFISTLCKNGTKTIVGKENGPAEIPEELKKHNPKFYFTVSEKGGATTNKGYSHIICDMSGEPITPYFAPTSGHLSNNIHASFFVDKCIKITFSIPEEIIHIFRICIEKKGNKVQLAREILWFGFYNELPNLFSKFKTPIKAAMDKAKHYHCRTPYYIKEK